MQISWTAKASTSLASIERYIAEDNPRTAQQTVDRISKAIEQLARFPAKGRPGRVMGTRELVIPRTPYVVPYRVKDDTVEILAVYHGARKWPKGF
jgi:toxin ParE1/3/4